ncbi:MAG: VOC family protein [Rhodothermales bacterium]|nr:VOC family protein [Rhodothermales bacterium]
MNRLSLSLLFLTVLLSCEVRAQVEPWVPHIEGRQFVAVITADIDTSAAWYSVVLGLGELDRWTSDDKRIRIINLRNDALFVELIELPDASVADRARGYFKVGFEVPDIDLVADRAGAATGERPRVIESPQHEIRFIQIRDPDDNVLQIFESMSE